MNVTAWIFTGLAAGLLVSCPRSSRPAHPARHGNADNPTPA